MIAIVNYGAGNPGSISNMLSRIGVEAVITADAGVITAAQKLILPGVGAFDAAMANLEKSGLIPVLDRQVRDRGVPILGICLGMQLFSKRSEEGKTPGLGWLDAETVRFQFDPAHAHLKIPHMGWNSIQVLRGSPILDGSDEDSRYYFVHSYHVRCAREENVLAVTRHGELFHSAVISGNIYGTQFHPEKSHKFGLRLLENFSRKA